MHPCEDWLSAADLADCELDENDVEALEDVDLDAFASLVSTLMYRLSGAQFPGLCPAADFYPYSTKDCGCSPRSCCCPPYLALPGPIDSVNEVEFDGETLVAGTDYRVQGKWRLQRLGGYSWPCPGRITEPGLLRINMVRGRAIPDEGVFAGKMLACQMLRSALGEECDLPFGTTQIVRSGITISTEAMKFFLEEMRTGVAETDAWLGIVNPHKRVRRSAVYRADDRRRVARSL